MEQYKFRIMIEAGKGELSLRKMPKSSKKKKSAAVTMIQLVNGLFCTH